MPGIGEPKVGMYHSLVQYHCPNPYFCETIKLAIPLQLMRAVRVRFSMYHKPTTICTCCASAKNHCCLFVVVVGFGVVVGFVVGYSVYAWVVDCLMFLYCFCFLVLMVCFVVVALMAASRLSRLEPFAVSHLKLMKDDDTTIEDGTHELFVYKVREGGREKAGQAH